MKGSEMHKMMTVIISGLLKINSGSKVASQISKTAHQVKQNTGLYLLQPAAVCSLFEMTAGWPSFILTNRTLFDI